MPICKNCEKWYPTSEHFNYCPLCGARIEKDEELRDSA